MGLFKCFCIRHCKDAQYKTVYVWPWAVYGHFQQGLTHFTDVHCLCTSHKASHMRWAGGRFVLVFSQTAFKLHKLLGTVLPDLLDHWAINTNIQIPTSLQMCVVRILRVDLYWMYEYGALLWWCTLCNLHLQFMALLLPCWWVGGHTWPVCLHFFMAILGRDIHSSLPERYEINQSVIMDKSNKSAIISLINLL